MWSETKELIVSKKEKHTSDRICHNWVLTSQIKIMNHLSRLLSILTILKSKRIITGTELAKKFDVSLRTIYRDIKKLEDRKRTRE